MSSYLTHTTRDGERWDHLADRYYGNPLRFEPIRRANPSVAGAQLTAGQTLRIPILDEEENTQDGLPPWRSA